MPVGDARLLHEGETREVSFELEAGSPGKRRILVTLPVATDDSAVVHAEPVVLEVYHGNESREIHAEYLRTRVRRLISKPGYDFEGVKPLLLELAALTPTDFGPLEWLADLSLGHTSLDETRLLYRRASEILQNETKADSKPPAIIAAYRTAKEQKFAAFERAYAFAHVTTGVQIQLLRQGRREEFVARQDRDGSALRVFD